MCVPSVRRLTHNASRLLKLLSDDYIALGLSQVAQAVAFLNADCKMVRLEKTARAGGPP